MAAPSIDLLQSWYQTSLSWMADIFVAPAVQMDGGDRGARESSQAPRNITRRLESISRWPAAEISSHPVVALALAFSTSHDAPAAQQAASARDDRPLAIRITAVAIDHDPIVRPPEIVGAGSVGEQGRVVPAVPRRVEDGQPAATFRIEAPGRDRGQALSGGRLPVFAVHTQELADRGDARVSRGAPHAAKPLREHGPYAGEPLRSESREPFKTAIVRGSFKVFESLEIQLIVQPRGEPAANPRYRREEPLGIGVASQAVKHRRVPEPHEVANRPCKALPDARHSFQCLDASPNRKDRRPVPRGDAERPPLARTRGHEMDWRPGSEAAPPFPPASPPPRRSARCAPRT